MTEMAEAPEQEELGVVGADLTEDTSGLLGDEGTGDSFPSEAPQEGFDPYNVNWSTVREEEVPEEWKPQLRTMRNIYGMVNKTNMDMRDTQKQMEDVTSQYSNALGATQQINQAQNPNAQNQDPNAQAQGSPSVLENFGFTPGNNGYDEAVGSSLTARTWQPSAKCSVSERWRTEPSRGQSFWRNSGSCPIGA